MNTDEALLLADSLDPNLDGRGVLTACVVLAAKVREQHAKIDQYRGLCRHAQNMLISAGDDNAADNIEAQVHRIDAGEAG